MKMPGFTAEVVLHSINGRYRVIGMSEQTSKSIYPAYMFYGARTLWSCFGRCLGTCPLNSSDHVSRDCWISCIEKCGGLPQIPSVAAT